MQRAPIRIALQLYSVRDQCARDLPQTLSAISKMGYHGVEFAGSHGYSATELKRMLDDFGLAACGAHKSLKSFSAENLPITIEWAKTLSCQNLIVGMMWLFTRGQWLRKAALFNEISAKLLPHDLRVGYHSHAHDFWKFAGIPGWDIFFQNTRPEVLMQLDTGNCRQSGASPIDVLKRYPGRAVSIHLKAYPTNTIIGSDDTDWKSIFGWCGGPGKTEWYVVEYSKSRDPLRTALDQINALKRLGKL